MATRIEIESIGFILLASGQAKRMGQNKLLMPIGKNEEPCIRKLAKMLTAFAPGNVLAIYQDDAVKLLLEDLPLKLTYNGRAALGQSEAIKLGVSQAWEDGVQAFAFVMGDQPLLTQEVLEQLVEMFWRFGADMVVPCVGDDQYAPVIFHRRWTSELLQLSGDKGAKGLLKHPAAKVIRVLFETNEAFIDMDTPEAYEALQEKAANLKNGG